MEIEHSRATGWVAWVLFGAVMLVLLGTLHLCVGLVALVRPEFLAGDRADLILDVPLPVLGWLHVVLGAAGLAAGVGLIRGRRWARVVAILLALTVALVDFAFLAVYPAWSAIAIALSGLVVYAVAAHDGEVADAAGS